MKRIFLLPLLVIMTCKTSVVSSTAFTAPIGQRYIEFISQRPADSSHPEWELLFNPAVRKVVNSKVVCSDRPQLIKQMCDVEKTYGVARIRLLELVESIDPKINVIHFEVTYNDHSIETVISIITCDETGLIKEINEVFGEKEIYQWQPNN